MNKKIYKYNLNVDSVINVTNDYEILDIQYQDDKLVAWLLVDLDSNNWKYKIKFNIYGTGWNCNEKYENYVKTVQDNNGLVWHIFKGIINGSLH